jgi:hypothetical protein
LTATYAKPLCEWNIPLECQFYWDIEDEQLCKKRNIQGLVEKHGEDVLLFINEQNKEQMLNIYDKMPDLHMITNMMDKERYDNIKERIKDTSYGFSNSTLLSGNFPGEVDNILSFITGSNKEQDYPKKDLSIFGRTMITLQLEALVQGRVEKCILNGFDLNTVETPYCCALSITVATRIEEVEEGSCTIVASLPE